MTLAEYWITSVEEFVSTARPGNARFGNGSIALAQALAIPEALVRALVRVGQAVLPSNIAFFVDRGFDVGMVLQHPLTRPNTMLAVFGFGTHPDSALQTLVKLGICSNAPGPIIRFRTMKILATGRHQ